MIFRSQWSSMGGHLWNIKLNLEMMRSQNRLLWSRRHNCAIWVKSDGGVVVQAYQWQESLSWVAGISHEPWGYALCQGKQVYVGLRQVSRVFVLWSCEGSWLWFTFISVIQTKMYTDLHLMLQCHWPGSEQCPDTLSDQPLHWASVIQSSVHIYLLFWLLPTAKCHFMFLVFNALPKRCLHFVTTPFQFK